MSPRPEISRVLMTTDAVGGVWNYALELARGLGSRGVTVVLATMGPRPSSSQRAAAALPNVVVRESDFRLEWMSNPWDDVDRAGQWLLGLAEEHRPDVIHLNGYAHAALDWPAPPLVVAHSCVYSWWQAVRGTPPPPDWAVYHQRVREGLAAAGLVVAPTAAMLDSLRRDYGVLPPTRVIPNGIDSTGFRPCAKEPFVLSVGRMWDEAKNVETLALAARDIGWPVRVVGEVVSPDEAEPRPPRRVHKIELLGVKTPHELAELYARAAIYALPARYEPFGLSALEAAMSGCALVLGDLPSLREIWDDAAWFVSPTDADALRFALRQLIARPDLCTEYALRARLRAAAFTARRMTNAYLESYARLPAATASDPSSFSACA